jgi:16S rRNA (guanine527-N7)-methyltransferase
MQLPCNLDLSDGVVQRLEIYYQLLLKWQKTINLVAPSTIANAWERHFLDSLGFLALVDNMSPKSLVDLGSGGGFPPLVVAICRPDISVVAVESDERKSIFMQSVSRETNTQNFSVRNARIESELDFVQCCDLVTARALAPLTSLMAYLSSSQCALFAKGQNVEQEIEDAKDLFQFDHVAHNHPENDASFIVELSNVKPLT